MKQSTMIAVGGVTVAVIAAAVIVGVSVSGNNDSSTSADTTDDFNQYCATYGISYDTQSEYNFRKTLYDAATIEIDKINSERDNTFTAGHNPTSVKTKGEQKHMYGYNKGN